MARITYDDEIVDPDEDEELGSSSDRAVGRLRRFARWLGGSDVRK